MKTTDETKPEYYTDSYKEPFTFGGIKHGTFVTTNYSAPQYRALFMEWYDKIKPFLDSSDKHTVLEILAGWEEETLAKFDLYTLVRHHFKTMS